MTQVYLILMYLIISVFPILAYEKNNAEWYNNVLINKIGLVEYRFVIVIERKSILHDFCNDMSDVVEKIADTIYKYVPNAQHPSIPSDFLLCSASFNKRKMIFFKQDYSTRFLLNKNEICIWSFKVDKYTGHKLISAKNMTKKIVAIILKKVPNSKIIKVIRIKGDRTMPIAYYKTDR